jgi:hypothetical protein
MVEAKEVMSLEIFGMEELYFYTFQDRIFK